MNTSPRAQASSPCRDCVFAVYEGNEQTACKLGRLDLLAANGAIIERYYDIDEAEYGRMISSPADPSKPTPPLPRDPNGKAFFRVNGRVCMYCRTPEWGEKSAPSEWEERARDEMRLRLHVIIPVSDSDTLESVQRTLSSVDTQTVPAAGTHVVLNTVKVRPYEVMRVSEFLANPHHLNVRLITERDKDTHQRVSQGRAVDLTVADIQVTKCNYYAVVKAGEVLPARFIESLDESLNGRMEQWILLEGDHLVVSTLMHQQLGGNAEAEHDGLRYDSIVEKAKLVAQDEGVAHFVKKVEDVCPQ